jgi:hypothetical protein
VAASLNERFFPILLMALEDPFVPGELEVHYKRLAQISDIANGRRIKLVAIVTSDPMVVSAGGRRQVVQALRSHLSPVQIAATAASFLPVDSTLVRGVLTAFRWVSPDAVKTLRVTPSMEEALREALLALRELGTPFTGNVPALRRELKLPT